eukprot:4747366-Pyramimonas_sp.AAC.1
MLHGFGNFAQASAMSDALPQLPAERAVEIWKGPDRVGLTLPTFAQSEQKFVAIHRFEVFEYEATLLSSYNVG